MVMPASENDETYRDDGGQNCAVDGQNLPEIPFFPGVESLMQHLHWGDRSESQKVHTFTS
jgi:hypothetical protein